jgi:hypothetical protein
LKVKGHTHSSQGLFIFLIYIYKINFADYRKNLIDNFLFFESIDWSSFEIGHQIKKNHVNNYFNQNLNLTF